MEASNEKKYLNYRKIPFKLLVQIRAPWLLDYLSFLEKVFDLLDKLKKYKIHLNIVPEYLRIWLTDTFYKYIK